MSSRWLALLFALIVAPTAQSQEVEPNQPEPTLFVESLHQTPRENDAQFLVRVATVLRDYTANTGYEGCGNLCLGPKGQTIMIFSAHSQIYCPAMKACALGDAQVIGEFIHSHPPTVQVKLNALDAKSINAKRRIFKTKVGRKMSVSPRLFSSEDYDLGPGYMVFRNEVWHQSGRGTAKLLFTLP